MDSWYLVFCKAKQEQRAKINLANQGIVSFFPQYFHKCIARGRVNIKLSPLFPNYLFVKFDSTTGSFSAVKNTRGVRGFVTYGSDFQIVPDHLITYLKQLDSERLENSNLPKNGDVVYLNRDSFKGVQAIYQEPDGETRSILLINLLNKQVKISVKNKELTTNTF